MTERSQFDKSLRSLVVYSEGPDPHMHEGIIQSYANGLEKQIAEMEFEMKKLKGEKPTND